VCTVCNKLHHGEIIPEQKVSNIVQIFQHMAIWQSQKIKLAWCISLHLPDYQLLNFVNFYCLLLLAVNRELLHQSVNGRASNTSVTCLPSKISLADIYYT